MGPGHTCDVLVIGAGIMGCALAYDLARTGSAVVLLDRGAVCGGSSGRNAGGVRHQFTHELNVRLATRSIARICELQEDCGLDLGFHAVGYLFLVSTAHHERAFRAMVARHNQWGVPSRFLSPEECAALVPGLTTADLRGGSFCPTDGYVDPHALVSGFAAAARQAGAVIRTQAAVVGLEVRGRRVTGVRTAGGERYAPGVVVNAAGVWAPAIARLYGGELPISPWRSQVVMLRQVPDLAEQLPLTIDFDHGKAYFRREGAGLLAGMDLGERDTDPAVARSGEVAFDWTTVPALAARLGHRVPALAEAVVTSGWAGLLELTPDDNPLVGWTDLDNLYTAAGFSGHGLSLVPGLAPEVAREVQGLPATLPLAAYRPDRFARGLPADEAPEALTLR